MNAVGIIVEYNPFHNGHLIHLNEAKKNGDVIIAVMSGDFVQRGEPAIINKWERAKTSILEGVDIVAELPVFYSTQSAEIFARGSVMTLKELNISKILFGSESGDINKLLKIINLEKNKNFIETLKKKLKEGNSYPSAYNNGIKSLLGENFQIKSNEILGIEYIRAIRSLNLKIKPITFKRVGGGYYSLEPKNNILSATGIRKLIKENKNVNIFLPETSKKLIKKNKEKKLLAENSKLYSLIRYSIIFKKEKLNEIQDVEIGFENRLYEMALKSESYDIFINNLITKRYTISRIQRILIHILLSINKSDTEKLKKTIPYIRILGFSEKGRQYLNQINKLKKENLEKNNVKILTSLKNIKKNLSEEQLKFLELNENASLVYRMVSNYKNRKIPLMEKKGRENEIR